MTPDLAMVAANALFAPHVPPTLSFRKCTEHSFILDSWLKSYWHLRACKEVDSAVYWPMQRRRIENLLARNMAFCACSPEEPGEVLGYVVFGMFADRGVSVLHYLYVKSAYRRLGIGRALLDFTRKSLPEGGFYYTHQTDERSRKLASAAHAIFNPYLLDGA